MINTLQPSQDAIRSGQGRRGSSFNNYPRALHFIAASHGIYRSGCHVDASELRPVVPGRRGTSFNAAVQTIEINSAPSPEMVIGTAATISTRGEELAGCQFGAGDFLPCFQ